MFPLLVGFLSLAIPGCSRGKAEEKPSSLPSALTVAERIAGRPAWLAPSEAVSPNEFEADPHKFACATCHGSTAENKTAKEWKATCASAGCHFRPWPKTVFHRVPLVVFNKCDNCHKPHVFKLNGRDCLSCHENLHGPAGTVNVTKLAGVTSFPHQKHASLECGSCHDSETTHGGLKVTSAETCRSCHHGPPPARDCTTCHATPAREVRVTRTLHLAGSQEQRPLPFDHARHVDLPCESCHEADQAATPNADCVSCHDIHHTADAHCSSCHEPPKSGVHTLAVHESGCQGSGCHGASAFASMEFNRNFCMSCHRDRSAHYPDKNCDGCHKMGRPSGTR